MMDELDKRKGGVLCMDELDLEFRPEEVDPGEQARLAKMSEDVEGVVMHVLKEGFVVEVPQQKWLTDYTPLGGGAYEMKRYVGPDGIANLAPLKAEVFQSTFKQPG